MEDPIYQIAGRQLYAPDLHLIRALVAAYGEQGLQQVALELCRCWSWRVCGRYHVRRARCVLTGLASRGVVEISGLSLPSDKSWRPSGEPPAIDTSALECSLSALRPLAFRLVETAGDDALFTHLLHFHHPLGNRRVIGEHLKYLVFADNRPIAALLWGRAALKLQAREAWLGWSPTERRENLDSLASNYRFLILPWIQVRNLASHVLAAITRRIGADWERHFGQTLSCLETFVDPDCFEATSYLAANWIPVGFTQGSGRKGRRYHYHGHPKAILLFPLSKKLRRLRSQGKPKEVTFIPLHPPQASMVLPDPSERIEGVSGTMTSILDIHGPTSELKDLGAEALGRELYDYCKKFDDVLPRSETRRNFGAVLAGFMSGIQKKNTESIALKGGSGIPVRTLQSFMIGSWSDEAVRIRHQELVAVELGHPEGILIVDGSGFPKKGSDSAGVGRQYCGATGKTDNCQMGVFLGYANPDGRATLLDSRLYVPKSWFTDEVKQERWDACHIPEDLEFRTKPQLALQMIQDLHQRSQLPFRWLLADEEFGQNTNFLDGLPDGVHFFVEVPSNTRLLLDPVTAGDLDENIVEARDVEQHVSLDWTHQVTLKEGAHGPLVADVARHRVIQVRGSRKNKRMGKAAWLFLRRHPKTGVIKYYLCSAPEDTPFPEMCRLSAMRWPIETCFQEAKDHLGMDHYQVRSRTGWHHHMTLVILAHHFLIYLKAKAKKKLLI